MMLGDIAEEITVVTPTAVLQDATSRRLHP